LKIAGPIFLKYKKSAVYMGFNLLESAAKRKIIKISIFQAALGGLDLIGVGLIGIIGALSVTGVKSGLPGGRLNEVISTLGLSNFSFQMQVALLGIFAVIVLVGKTIISAIYTRRIFRYLGFQGALLSTQIIKSILSKSILFSRSRNIQEFIFVSSNGANALSIGLLGGVINLIADISLTFVIGLALIVIDPFIAFSTFTLFGLVFHILNKATQEKSRILGTNYATSAVESNKIFEETIRLFREIELANHTEAVVARTRLSRTKLSEIAAEVAFLPNLSKYVIETSILVGALILSAFQFLVRDSSHAIATLAVFIAAGTRIAPALLRIQQGILIIRNSTGTAMSTIKLIRDLEQEPDNSSSLISPRETPFVPNVTLKDVSFQFPGANEKILADISLSIKAGSRVAIVGPSGSGKSTFLDVMLGIIPPTAGVVSISNLSARDASAAWPGKIGYVPQDVWLADGTVKENILLGWGEDFSDLDLKRVIRQSNLIQMLEDFPNGLQTLIGGDGQSLSGGQRQRIGIARALLTQPQLLVMDEATSSLDSNSENLITNAISNLENDTTVIIIAHRLASIMSFERIVYLDKGQVLADGTFEEVRSAVPEFDHQANLLGL
jgi:ABC-type bacteriocin/lantibiotic exporter with double-glycine peptidase domain